MNTKAAKWIGCVSLLALSGCSGLAPNILDPKQHDISDPALQLRRSDYRNMLDPQVPTAKQEEQAEQAEGGFSGYKATVSSKAADEPPIPDIAPILAAPQPPKLGQTKLVSIAVTDDVPLKDVLLELSRLADIDIEIDAGISGGIAFRAKDRPFNEVIERIADLAGLRYRMKNNVLRIERDTPYVDIYSLDFLNIDRSTQNSVNISTNVLSGGGGSSSSSSSGGSGSSGGGGSGLNTGSQSSITSKTDSDFWVQFEAGIKQILNFTPTSHVAQANIPAQAPAPVAQPVAAGATGAPVPVLPPAPVAASQSTQGTPEINGSEKPFYILNKQASTLTLSATDKQHHLIKEFLRRINANASAQVLIEAKIVEVTLSEQFQSGIDWARIGTDKINSIVKFGAITDAANVATLNVNAGNDLQAAVNLTETFGTTRTLSSPRLHAINNQQAVLTFAENQVYFQLKIDKQTSTGTSTTTETNVTSEIKTVPIGIILTMMPSINLDTSEITLNVRPTLSRVTSFVNDPAVAYLVAQTPELNNLESKVPVVEVRELDSILKLKSSQVMVIGGLMEDKSENTERGAPGLSEVPIVGNLFKGIDRSNKTKELVIFIRATIIDSRGNATEADKSLYEKFTHDPRPLAF